jgi:MoxR-like ATPase
MNKIEFENALAAKFGSSASKKDIREFASECGMGKANWLLTPENRIARGMYAVNAQVIPMTQVKEAEIAKTVSMNMDNGGFADNLIPEVDPLYVPFGNSKTVRDVIKSKMFYPIYITGLSGNGKTFGVEQECAKTKREVIRVNFTVETDEDDLIGGFRLVDGETKFFKGPVIKAMEMGAVLLLDEIDLANPAKIMCLQSILEGKGYFIKKTGEFVKPANGFTCVATANTKGKGSDDGRFIGTNVMNEAFLERFPVTFEQEYPTPAVEKKIIGAVFADLEVNDTEFVEKLVDWADIIRKTFYDGGVDEIISTRRLVHIAKAYKIFDDRMTAINMCINRFDDDTKASFADLYTKIDSGVVVEETEDQSVENSTDDLDNMPF